MYLELSKPSQHTLFLTTPRSSRNQLIRKHRNRAFSSGDRQVQKELSQQSQRPPQCPAPPDAKSVPEHIDQPSSEVRRCNSTNMFDELRLLLELSFDAAVWRCQSTGPYENRKQKTQKSNQPKKPLFLGSKVPQSKGLSKASVRALASQRENRQSAVSENTHWPCVKHSARNHQESRS